jgi:transposase
MLWSQDEARFGRMNNPKRCWAPPKTRPLVRLQRIREYMYVFAANSPWAGDTYSLIFPVCNTSAMELFLEGFSRQYSAYNNIMIVDQAAWHVTKKIAQFDNIKFIYLPPGSPELNPTEHLWEHIREKYFGNHVYNSLDEIEEEMVMALQKISHDKETIKQLTGFHWLNIS